MKEKAKILLLTIGIFLLAAFFRLYGVNWDQGQHLHPDERFLTMVATGISWPGDLSEYLDTSLSPLNPHNRGFGFFVYGTFPIFFTKWVAESLGLGDYGSLTLVGRQLSAILDLGTVLLVFLIAREMVSSITYYVLGINKNIRNTKYVIPNTNFPLLSMFLYSIMVLPIQLSHFYAVDTYLTFFITLSFYLLIRILNSKLILNSKFPASPAGGLILNSLLGVSFGLALASKISAALFLPIIGLGFLIVLVNHKNLRLFFVSCLLFFVSCFITFRLAQPYAFASGNIFDITLNPKVLENWKQLKSFDDATGGFPPAVQWITTKPYLFPLKNLILWGLGLPLGIIAILAVTYHVLRITYYVLKKKLYLILNTYYLILFLSLLWILILLTYQGSQFVKALRYFFPIYPFLAILSGYFLFSLKRLNLLRGSTSLGFWFIGLLVLIYPLSFLSIYSRPHSRVAASQWIYKNIPAGSIISGEHWDDFLPMSLPIPGYIHEKYKSVELPLYYPDKPEKWKEMDTKLKTVDYIVLSSNRLYGSITTVPAKFPVTNRYYQALFDGSLGFEKVAEFTSRPNLPIPGVKVCLTPPFVRYGIVALKSQECSLPGISLVDDYADETLTVYDHPKVIIFKKVKTVDYYNLLFSNTQ